MVVYIRYGALCLLLLLALYQDITARRVKNWLSLGGLAAGLLLSVFGGLAGLGRFALGAAFALGLGLLLWGLKAFRAGDAKLYAALGGLMGFGWVWRCYVLSFLVGGLAALFMLARRGLLGVRLRYMGGWLRAALTGGKPGAFQPDEALAQAFPFTVAIAAGAVLTELWLRVI